MPRRPWAIVCFHFIILYRGDFETFSGVLDVDLWHLLGHHAGCDSLVGVFAWFLMCIYRSEALGFGQSSMIWDYI
jgi:hypothetical protein